MQKKTDVCLPTERLFFRMEVSLLYPSTPKLDKSLKLRYASRYRS
jgi:hypothetical protein